MTTTEKLLSEQASAILQVVQESEDQVCPPAEIQAVTLADFYHYNVIRDRFAQLIYNLQGEYLAEIDDMLRAANARVAGEFYVQSIELCLSNLGRYQVFLASDFITQDALKDTFLGLSIAYLCGDSAFIDEAAPFILTSRTLVERWLTRQRSAGQ